MRTPCLGLIGVGAFGELCLRDLAGHFRITACDPRPDLAAVAPPATVSPQGRWPEAARQDIVLLAMPVRALAQVAADIAPLVRPGTLVIDVCSIKTRPMAILCDTLPDHVDIVGTHPLFGPQSGRDGIAGLRIAVCPGRGHPRGPGRRLPAPHARAARNADHARGT